MITVPRRGDVAHGCLLVDAEVLVREDAGVVDGVGAEGRDDDSGAAGLRWPPPHAQAR